MSGFRPMRCDVSWREAFSQPSQVFLCESCIFFVRLRSTRNHIRR